LIVARLGIAAVLAHTMKAVLGASSTDPRRVEILGRLCAGLRLDASNLALKHVALDAADAAGFGCADQTVLSAAVALVQHLKVLDLTLLAHGLGFAKQTALSTILAA
jgi:hypothetical protein